MDLLSLKTEKAKQCSVYCLWLLEPRWKFVFWQYYKCTRSI